MRLSEMNLINYRIVKPASTSLEKPRIYFCCIIKDSDLTKTCNNKYINCLILTCTVDNINNTDVFFNCYYENCEFEIN